MSLFDPTSATIAAAGDAIVTQRLSPYHHDGLEPLVSELRAADASMVNLETLVHDYEGYPREQHGDVYMRSPPWVLDELEWMGFDLFAAANNHTDDFSHGGMLATMRELDDRDLPFAGLGKNLADARAPAYCATESGRVGLVAAATTFPAGASAGQARPDFGGRPGLAPLSLSSRYRIPAEEMAHLERISDELGLEAIKTRRNEFGFPAPWGEFDQRETFTLLDVLGSSDVEFESSDDEYEVILEAEDDDLEAITNRIAEAARQADWVIASLHAHEGAGGRDTDQTIPAFLERVARACIDAGADAFVGHGPHLLRGMEIYDGAPIFYSLGNFAMQSETYTRQPTAVYEQYGLGSDATVAELADRQRATADGTPRGFALKEEVYESVIPICRFEQCDLEVVELLPISLGFDRDRPHRGRPKIATGAQARRILSSLDELSTPYGVDIEIENERGIVEP